MKKALPSRDCCDAQSRAMMRGRNSNYRVPCVPIAASLIRPFCRLWRKRSTGDRCSENCLPVLVCVRIVQVLEPICAVETMIRATRTARAAQNPTGVRGARQVHNPERNRSLRRVGSTTFLERTRVHQLFQCLELIAHSSTNRTAGLLVVDLCLARGTWASSGV